MGVKADKGGTMSKISNPYPEMITDECSDTRISNIKHKIWAEGYEAGRSDEQADEDENLRAK
jgi:hypothetical protein